MSTLTSGIKELRTQVSALHGELVRNGLVAWTQGNVSARVPGEDLIVIKPSGVAYDELTPESMVVVDLDGTVVEGDLAPVQRRRDARATLPRDAARRRRRAHAQPVRDAPGRRSGSRSRAC